MASQLVEKKEICEALNYTAKEIDDLVRLKQIPHISGIVKIVYEVGEGVNKRTKVRYDKKPGHVLFPKEEILLKMTPRPKSTE